MTYCSVLGKLGLLYFNIRKYTTVLKYAPEPIL